MTFRVLYQDKDLIAIDKPEGYQVHPPENKLHRIAHQASCLHRLRDQLGQWVYPIHRLDSATSGVLLFALTPEAASEWGTRFRTRTVKKTYFAVVRGWVDDSKIINHSLKNLESGELQEAITRFECLRRIEMPQALGRYDTARFSLVEVEPETGRQHQIRRHFAHLRHPLIGDTRYGDGLQNRFFREHFQMRSLLLRAMRVEFVNVSGETQRINAGFKKPWHQVFDLMGVCPLGFARTL